MSQFATATETLLLGPGPSNVPAAVRAAQARPMVGHLDPRFIAQVEQVKAQLRVLFATQNAVTFPVSGTGSAGMEAVLVNLLEPGDRVVVGVNGVFGTRIANLAERYGAQVTRVQAEWGRAVPYADLQAAVAAAKPKILAVVNGETSTGVYQPMDGLGELAHSHGALLLVDCVTSLGGMPVTLDAWGADLVYSGTQKCLNCPPGLAPVSFSLRALEVFRARRSQVPSFYLDLGEILKYLGDGQGARSYHHTAPVSMVAALDEALQLVLAEGLPARWARHRAAQEHLIVGLQRLGLEPLVPHNERLWPLTTVRLPGTFDEATVRKSLLMEEDMEIGGGLGPLAGKVWRIGLMGVNAHTDVVDRLLAALASRLP